MRSLGGQGDFTSVRGPTATVFLLSYVVWRTSYLDTFEKNLLAEITSHYSIELVLLRFTGFSLFPFKQISVMQ